MHGCSSGPVLLVNAEVDSMGGVVDGGTGIGVKTSPRRAAIEKAQAELRQEFDVREERRRELEFLEKGGNPLDFKSGNAASLSVQSTSLTDQHPEQFVTSDVKGSFALTASPHGDSIESSGRPGTRTVCEPNSADNLLLFDGENELTENKKSVIRPGKRNNIASSEKSSHAREAEDSTIFRPYARRNRSKTNRDGARSSSTDIIQSRGGHGSLVSRGGSKDAKGSISEANKQKNHNVLSNSNPKSASSNGDMVPKIATSNKQMDTELDATHGVLASRGPRKGSLPERKLQVIASKAGMEPQPSRSDGQTHAVNVYSERPDVDDGKEQDISAATECPPCAATEATVLSENEACSDPLDGLSNLKVDRKTIPSEVQNRGEACSMKGLDSESSCTQTNPCLDVNNDSDVCTNQRNMDFNGNSEEQKSKPEGLANLVSCEFVKETNETKAATRGAIGNDDSHSFHHNHTGNGSLVKIKEEIDPIVSGEQKKVKHPPNMEGVKNNLRSISGSDKTVGNVFVDKSNINKENSSTNQLSSLSASASELPANTLLGKTSASEPEHFISDDHLKLANKAHEDSVLEEAQIIEAKRKGIADLSIGILHLETRRKSHWDFVLAEMAWLANDFAQERLWKITAASQMCRLATSAFLLKLEKQSQGRKLKKVVHAMADAVMQFWHSAEMLISTDVSSVDSKSDKYDSISSRPIDGEGTMDDNIEEPNMKTSKELEQSPSKSLPLALQLYAVRFLKSTRSPVPTLHAEAPATPEKISDTGVTEMSWEDHLTEENLFYTVPSGAMEAYRKSIESHLVQSERTCSSMQEEVETHMYDAVAEYGYQESTYDEDEGETSSYYLPGAFDGSKASNSQKKRKFLMKSYSARLYERPTDVPYGHLTTVAQQSMVMGKRPANNLNVGAIPTKRMRTAIRQRVLTPFGAGGVQAPAKTGASSGDTNSFQDDQSTMRDGSQIQKNIEVESAVEFKQHMPYDSAETFTKPKKKKKKHMVHNNSYILADPGGLLNSGKGTAYDQGWQLDSTVHSEQRDHFKRRAEGHHFDSNGISGLYGQQNVKRPKTLKQPVDKTFDNISPMTGSIPSPAASMSNMSNPNKFIKLMGGRDRGRKAKGLKMSTGQPGSGSPWSLFEDQALVVLVHDMGPNWELVSDAVNSTLQFKCIFRNPKECKERHKILMDRSAGDGADSAEDSGSSQSYPSTLPGIPKGSARQLFQCLQGPMVEDTLKSHFEKIIAIGQKHHYRIQNDNQDAKQIAQVHNSHVIALSQAFPNNLSGNVLTPLDLCDTTPSSPDVLPIGYQGSHAGGLPMSNQGSVASALPTPGPNSSVQGSSGMVLGSNLQSPSGPLGVSARDGRFGVPRPSLPADEHQRMQQYNQMLSGRNIQQPSLTVPGALSGTDRGARMNGMGIMPGMHRSMSMARPGFQGMTSSSVLNSGGMLPSNNMAAGMPSSAMHSGCVPGPGNSMMRPRESLQMMRPGHNSDHQRQMMSPELPMQGNSQGIAPFNGLSASFPNQTTPPAQTYPVHTQQHQMPLQHPPVHTNPHHPHLQGSNHAPGAQQQAYAMHIAKERQQQQQRFLQQQQPQQFVASNSLLPHTQVQPPQHPLSSALPNNSPIHSQMASQPVSLPPQTPSSPMAPLPSQHQQKNHLQPRHGRNPQTSNSGLTNQMGKQRQRQTQQQQFQQPGRHHPQQRQHAAQSQQPKLLKGMGRGNTLVHQNLPVDPSRLNGLTVASGSQSGENQGPYPGSSLNSVQSSKPLVPSQPTSQSPLQEKLHSGQTPSKQLQQTQLGSGHTFAASHQASPPPVGLVSPQPQMHQKPVIQTVQRIHQQNRQAQSDLPLPGKAAVDQAEDKLTAHNAPERGTPESQACDDSPNAGPVLSSDVSQQWKASEPVCDSSVPNTATTQVAATRSPPPLSSSAESEPALPTYQGLGQRQLSGSLPLHNLKTGTQWHQQSQLQQSSTAPLHLTQPLEQPPPPIQEEQQDQHSSPPQLTPQQPSQQQTQHLQSEQGSLCIEPTTSELGGN